MGNQIMLVSWVVMAILVASGNAREQEEERSTEDELTRLLVALQKNHDEDKAGQQIEGMLEERKHKGKPHEGPHEGPHSPHGGSHPGHDHDSLEQAMKSENSANSRIENLEQEKQYEFRSDIFEDVRWQDVYADELEAREGRVMNSLTSAQEKAILDLHNELRRKEGSSNMETLKYNHKLAELGQTWSKRCVFEHGQPPFSEAAVGYKDLGQNIFAHSNPNFKVEDAVQAWYDEKKDYQYNSASCNAGKVCGHYTAVTWAKTTEVGCGLTFCPSISGLSKAHFIVCNYAPPGNWQGEKPFLKGPSCTQCDSGKFYCNNGLCDKACNSEGSNCQCKAACQKGGKKTGQCTCECPAGSTGPDCGLQCADRDPKCGANPGYPQFLCTLNDPKWSFVKEKCPKLCKACSKKRSTDDMNALRNLLQGYLEKKVNEEEQLE